MMSLPRIGWAALAASAVILPLAIAHGGTASGLKPASAFALIADPKARSAAIFTEMGKVLTSPRCLRLRSSFALSITGKGGAPSR